MKTIGSLLLTVKYKVFGAIKLRAFMQLSINFTVVFQLIAPFIFHDWQFLGYLIAMITVDTLLGIAIAVKAGQLSSKGFGMVLTKIIIYGAALELTHLLTHFQIDGKQNIIFGWFNTFVYTSLMVKEGLSIIINVNKLKVGFFPAWLMQKFADFDEKGIPITAPPATPPVDNTPPPAQ